MIQLFNSRSLYTKVKSKGKDLYEKRQEHVEKWAEKSDQRRTKIQWRRVVIGLFREFSFSIVGNFNISIQF